MPGSFYIHTIHLYYNAKVPVRACVRAFVTNLPSADSLRVMQFFNRRGPNSILIFVLRGIYSLMESIMSVLPERVRQRQRKTDIERHREKQAKTDKGILFIFDERKRRRRKNK